MIFLEFDKAGAEWVVVAYLSGGENMISVVEQRKKPHTITGSLMSGLSEEQVNAENKIVGHHTDAETVRRLRS